MTQVMPCNGEGPFSVNDVTIQNVTLTSADHRYIHLTLVPAHSPSLQAVTAAPERPISGQLRLAREIKKSIDQSIKQTNKQLVKMHE